MAGYVILGALTGSNLKVDNIIPEHIEMLTLKLKEMGITMEIGEDYIITSKSDNLKPISITTQGYPGFATDLQQPITTLLTKVILYERELNVISKTVKTVGSTALGNFVGYWYYFKDGRKRFRFETINKNLQMSKFAKNGWITVFDDKFKESSYKFAANGDLIVNTKTEEGIEVDAIGQAKVNNTVTKLNIITKPIDTNFVKGAEVDRYYEVNVSTADMVSKEVDDRGITKDITKATRIFTTTPLENELVALNQTKK